ncbi:MAG: hypothetical protein EZS28_038367 [Streblomastix strix]|uniref:Reverse transcriptase domain-containing protein n=1 Tax=Streblomastix strix TaxID=222440 RepID=A0A5J4U8T4_9EUKA|nr:MAG: hypothetical protein EZS28_038367 [Streblomastix strix]
MISPFDVQQALPKNSCLGSIDTKCAFNHITIYSSLQPYLRFELKDRSYIDIGMPFGLRLAPIILTKNFQMALAAIKEGTLSISYKRQLDKQQLWLQMPEEGDGEQY